jgi:hypothetical protein
MGDESAIAKENSRFEQSARQLFSRLAEGDLLSERWRFCVMRDSRFNERALATENARLRNAQKVGLQHDEARCQARGRGSSTFGIPDERVAGAFGERDSADDRPLPSNGHCLTMMEA